MRSVDDERQTAPAWRAPTIDRLLARLIDFWVVFLVAAGVIIVGLSLGLIEDDSDSEGTAGAPTTSEEPREREWLSWGPRAPTVEGVLALGAGIAAVVAYEAGLTLLMGSTPGKRAMKLRVVDAETRRPAGTRTLVIRALALGIPAVFALAMWWTSVFMSWAALAFCLWLAWPLLAPNSDGRTRYDRLAGSSVAKRDAT